MKPPHRNSVSKFRFVTAHRNRLYCTATKCISIPCHFQPPILSAVWSDRDSWTVKVVADLLSERALRKMQTRLYMREIARNDECRFMKLSSTKRVAGRCAFSLIEVLIAVVLMSIIAAMVIPSFTDASEEAKEASALKLLQQLRTNAQLQHVESSTGKDIIALPTPFPANPLTGKNSVKTIFTTFPDDPGDLTPGGGGWIYSNASHYIWLDTAGYLDR